MNSNILKAKVKNTKHVFIALLKNSRANSNFAALKNLLTFQAVRENIKPQSYCMDSLLLGEQQDLS